MPLESASFISQLNIANPASTDTVSQADDHLRLIKSVLKATFPNLDAPVTATPASLNAPVPVGLIAMWSGAINAVPTGWALCDGTNGTPNLRDRFVVGAGTTYAVGATGGSNTVSLTTSQMPAHTHSVTATGSTDNQGLHTHTINDPGHGHTYGRAGGIYGNGFAFQDQSINGTGYTTNIATTGITMNGAGGHTHSVIVNGNTSQVGGSEAHENRPPYYALAYIMKV